MIAQAPMELELGMDLEGLITRLDVFEDAPSNVSHVITTTSPTGVLGENWGVNLTWEIDSPMAGNPHNPLLLPNIFNVRVYLEGFGPGTAGVANEFELPAAPFVVNYGPPAGATPGGAFINANTRRWEVSIPFGPPLVTIPEGLYKLGVTIIMLQPVGGVNNPLPAAGYIEGPLVQFYVPVP